MGCRTSIFKKNDVEQERSVTPETGSSLVTSDITELDMAQDTACVIYFAREEDQRSVAQRNTDALDIAEKDENNLFENGAYDENGDYLIAADARSGASPFVHLTLCRYADRETNRQQTLPALHVCGATDDGVHKEESQMWYNSILEIVCGHARKKCCTRDRMQVIEPIPQLVARVRKGAQDFRHHLLTKVIPSIVKILLISHKDDQQMHMLANASRRLGWSVSVANKAEKALETFQNRVHEIVIIDHREPWMDEADAICSIIKSSPVYQTTIVVALVKKSYFTVDGKDHMKALKLLEIGYARTLLEHSDERIIINELIGIYTSSLLPRTQLTAAHALYLALDKCHNMVQVTDNKNIVQFLNKVSEKLLGYKVEEVMGRSVTEIVYYENFTFMEQQLNQGQEVEGNMTCKKKNNQTIILNCKVTPFCSTVRKPTHYIYVYDTYLPEIPAPIKPLPIRKDISDANLYKKLHTMQLEAPITRVIEMLLTAVTETINPETANLINQAIEILKTTELYEPHLRQHSDRGTQELISALLATPRLSTWDEGPSPSDLARLAAIRAASVTNDVCKPIKVQASDEIKGILKKCLDWDFKIFELESLTENRPLVFVGTSLMSMFCVPAKLKCEERVIQNWLAIIEHNYNSDNSYHNSTHAADVMQATAKFMQSEKLKKILEPLDEISILIAAAAHDIDHPGRSSQFLCNANDHLAILYNDLSVLESHHAALTFKLSLSDDNVNIFKNLERDTYKVLRQNIIDMILATEMTKHFEHLAKFMNVCSSMGQDQDEIESRNPPLIMLPDNVMLVKRMMIKCADVSNPTRPLKYCIEWARRIAEEYFRQTDEEKNRHMPVVMPMFDRITCSIPKSQMGFVDYIISDMIEAWDVFIDMPQMVTYMQQNYQRWKQYNEQGIVSLQDIQELQQDPDLQIFVNTEPTV